MRAIEEKINKIRPSVKTSIRVEGTDLLLSYEKRERWGLVITDTKMGTSWYYNDAPHYHRIKAVKALADLIPAIRATSQATRERASEALKMANRILDDMEDPTNADHE